MKQFSQYFPIFWGFNFLAIGILHFTHMEQFLPLMPSYLPAHEALVYVSGLAEVLGGIGLLIPATRTYAVWGLWALVIAVFPANVHAAIVPGSMPVPQWAAWFRLPVQMVFIIVLSYCRTNGTKES